MLTLPFQFSKAAVSLMALCGICAAQTAWAAQRSGQACAPYSKPITLDFKTLAPKPVYHNGLSIQGIRNMFSSHTEAVLGPHERALGITYAETQYAVDARSQAVPARGGHCVYLTEVNVSFGWKRMNVYIASEFTPGTCEYKTVLDHENQHVAVNNGSLKEYAPRFRAETEKVLRTIQPVFSPDAEAGMDAALAPVQKRMSEMLAQFQDVTAQRNAPLDSRSNYSETGKLCANWNQLAPPPKRR
jgi:hypothetical protein